MIVLAGRRERRGLLESARRLARRGGFVAAGSTMAALVTGVAWVALSGPTVRDRLFEDGARGAALLTLGVSLTVLAGFVGLLAGLSGKPRPGGGFAAAILLAGLGTVLAVALR